MSTEQNIFTRPLLSLDHLGLFWSKVKAYISSFTYTKDEIEDKITPVFVGTMDEYLEAYRSGSIKEGTLVIITEE